MRLLIDDGPQELCEILHPEVKVVHVGDVELVKVGHVDGDALEEREVGQPVENVILSQLIRDVLGCERVVSVFYPSVQFFVGILCSRIE